MSDIPAEFRRITEDRIDSILHRHLSTSGALSKWLFERTFRTSTFVQVNQALLRRHHDHRRISGDPLAYGENDIEVVARIKLDGKSVIAGLLVEDKVDARQGLEQGSRYQARARYRQSVGEWEEYRCVLVAPLEYLSNAYPLGLDSASDWNALISFEDVAGVLKADRGPREDVSTLLGAADLVNKWNKPIPEAVRFWQDLRLFQLTFHPDVPLFADPQTGARVNVWPSFYENQLRGNKREVRRKRIQLVHSGKRHISLFVKNVPFEDFSGTVQPLLEPGLNIGAPGGSWQSIQIAVPEVSPLSTVHEQADKLDQVFLAARRLYEFFLRHESSLLAIRTVK
jgi:hypothetical protein